MNWSVLSTLNMSYKCETDEEFEKKRLLAMERTYAFNLYRIYWFCVSLFVAIFIFTYLAYFCIKYFGFFFYLKCYKGQISNIWHNIKINIIKTSIKVTIYLCLMLYWQLLILFHLTAIDLTAINFIRYEFYQTYCLLHTLPFSLK